MSDTNSGEFNPKTDFKYVVGEKEALVLVLLYGKISNRELGTLNEIEGLLKEKTQRIVLLNFHDVTVVMPAVHQFFAKFQKGFRDEGKLLGICGLKPDIRLSLLQSGIVREAELFNNIPDAWKMLSFKAQTLPAKTSSTNSEKMAA